MRNFGFAGYDRVVYVGTNGKMAEAARRWDSRRSTAIDNSSPRTGRIMPRYTTALAGIPGISDRAL